MPMIKHKKTTKEKSLIKAQVNPALLKQLMRYCAWAGYYDLGYFIEKVTENFMNNDTEWQLHLQKMQAEEEENTAA